LPARGVSVGVLPKHMQRFHVGTCEFLSPSRLRQKGHMRAEIAADLADRTLALVEVPEGNSAGYSAHRLLLEAYGFLAVSCGTVPSIGKESYGLWGERLAPTADAPPVDLIAIEPELRAAGFFRIEDELFRAHSETRMGKQLKGAMGWLGSALHAFDSPAELPALVAAIRTVLDVGPSGPARDRIGDAVRGLAGWDGWAVAETAADAGISWADDASPQRLLPHLRNATMTVLEQSLAAGDYENDHSQTTV